MMIVLDTAANKGKNANLIKMILHFVPATILYYEMLPYKKRTSTITIFPERQD